MDYRFLFFYDNEQDIVDYIIENFEDEAKLVDDGFPRPSPIVFFKNMFSLIVSIKDENIDFCHFAEEDYGVNVNTSFLAEVYSYDEEQIFQRNRNFGIFCNLIMHFLEKFKCECVLYPNGADSPYFIKRGEDIIINTRYLQDPNAVVKKFFDFEALGLPIKYEKLQ